MDGNAVAIAGGYTDKKGTHAYVRNLAGTKMLVYDWPKSILTHFEGITGAGGAGNYNVIGDYFDLKNKTLEYGFFLPIRNWTAGTATVIGPVSANSVYEAPSSAFTSAPAWRTAILRPSAKTHGVSFGCDDGTECYWSKSSRSSVRRRLAGGLRR